MDIKNQVLKHFADTIKQDSVSGLLLFDNLNATWPVVLKFGFRLNNHLQVELKSLLLWRNQTSSITIIKKDSTASSALLQTERHNRVYQILAVPLFLTLFAKVDNSIITVQQFDRLFFLVFLPPLLSNQVFQDLAVSS